MTLGGIVGLWLCLKYNVGPLPDMNGAEWRYNAVGLVAAPFANGKNPHCTHPTILLSQLPFHF